MATYVIGDLQGCLSPLERLLEKVKFDPSKDRLWFVGDLVNRGPKSLQTLRFVKSLGESAITVLGNHDLHLLAVVYGYRKPSGKDTLKRILQAPDRDDLCQWLASQPLMHTDAALGHTLVHAGIHPHWSLQRAQKPLLLMHLLACAIANWMARWILNSMDVPLLHPDTCALGMHWQIESH